MDMFRGLIVNGAMTRLSNLDVNRMSLPKHVLTTKRCSEQHCSKGFGKSNGICVDLSVDYNTERCSQIYLITQYPVITQ